LIHCPDAGESPPKTGAENNPTQRHKTNAAFGLLRGTPRHR
jgi:hypothetical protein